MFIFYQDQWDFSSRKLRSVFTGLRQSREPHRADEVVAPPAATVDDHEPDQPNRQATPALEVIPRPRPVVAH
ncbi:hypothetical protein [Cryptosporangium phraense]|uniref:Uncharacterized protein n=1 Tax=Cryptosporangium phraense TaxID=2593070 RepID=A0A545AYM7_9ACTN|nr:hypothetical protein [Cryptosporangium phraense]TQS46439.1 hypothetical protein FL583_03350 [Cryptosporangium phraense]